MRIEYIYFLCVDWNLVETHLEFRDSAKKMYGWKPVYHKIPITKLEWGDIGESRSAWAACFPSLNENELLSYIVTLAELVFPNPYRQSRIAQYISMVNLFVHACLLQLYPFLGLIHLSFCLHFYSTIIRSIRRKGDWKCACWILLLQLEL